MSGLRALLVFAKTPNPGKVKTRLIAAVSARDAAVLQAACIADTLRLVRQMRGCDGIVFAAGGTSYFSRLVKKFGHGARVQVLQQRGTDLGSRMENAFRKCFAMGYREVVVIGTDTPWMGAERVLRAFAELKTKDVVIGPADDGGYYLLGMRTMMPDIFQGISWSTDRVLDLTLKAIVRCKLRKKLLRRDFDLDRPEDLERAARMLKKRPRMAPALAAEVDRIYVQRKSRC
ncbi:MAG TPA: TIGR04282 family arsenosugar biosynthesis glycosyltransferase [Candidatus Limnocylindrales bacterium]|nr:TIGR04282 family arsenosugar biosynthesis glycosyltransferase [Candidatus Limnocylindrales bacterium]